MPGTGWLTIWQKNEISLVTFLELSVVRRRRGGLGRKTTRAFIDTWLIYRLFISSIFFHVIIRLKVGHDFILVQPQEPFRLQTFLARLMSYVMLITLRGFPLFSASENIHHCILGRTPGAVYIALCTSKWCLTLAQPFSESYQPRLKEACQLVRHHKYQHQKTPWVFTLWEQDWRPCKKVPLLL